MVAERDEPTGALVRPYAVTRGRTRPRLDIALEALVETTARGRSAVARDGTGHGREQQYIASLCDGRLQSLAEIAAREGLAVRYVGRLIRLAFLAPDIVESIVEGRQPTSLTAEAVTRHIELPLEWRSQKTALNLQ